MLIQNTLWQTPLQYFVSIENCRNVTPYPYSTLAQENASLTHAQFDFGA